MRKQYIAFLLVMLPLLYACGASSADTAAQEEAVAGVNYLETDAPACYDVGSAGILEEELEEVLTETYAYSGSTVDSDDGIQYFVFSQNTTTYHDEKGRQLLTESLTAPVFYAADRQLDRWIDGILREIYAEDTAYGQELLENARSEMAQLGSELFYSYSQHVSMGISRHDDQIISLLSLATVYSGGTNPTLVQDAYNLDLNNYQLLALEDVLRASGTIRFRRLVQKAVEDKFSSLGDGALYDNYAEIIESALNYGSMTGNWYFSEGGLVIYFNPYSLGSNTSGVIRVQINYEDLDGILQEEYFPEAKTGTVTDISLTSEPAAGEQVYYVNLGEGDTVYISVEGEAHHVQFSQVFWAGGTPVGESMLFSANRVDGNTIIAVTGNLVDTEKVYALEYSDQEAGANVVYIQGLEVIETLPADK